MVIGCNVEYWRIGIDDELADSDAIARRGRIRDLQLQRTSGGGTKGTADGIRRRSRMDYEQLID
jgi:hypothetical protein